MTRRAINTCKWKGPLILILRGRYHSRWVIELIFWDRWDIGQGFSNESSLKNQKCCDNRIWLVGVEFCDMWEDTKGLSDRSSLNNHQFDTYIGMVFSWWRISVATISNITPTLSLYYNGRTVGVKNMALLGFSIISNLKSISCLNLFQWTEWELSQQWSGGISGEDLFGR